MNYDKIGAKIRNIREKELHITREKFAEEIGVSPVTVTRLENSTSRVNNIETYIRISEISGYTIDEIISDKQNSKDYVKLRRKVDYLLNVTSNDELNYIFELIHNFLRYTHRNEINTLKDIKNKSKKRYN